MTPAKILRSACVLAATLMVCSSANALLFRAYVASAGSDLNPCTLPQPCRLLPAALAAVADGGEIWMLDSGNFNVSQVSVAKSVTILAIPGALGSMVATGGGDALNINAPGAKVTLRNLVIVHLTSSANGINFVQGAELNVAECEIANMTGNAINATASGSKVTVKNTVLRNSNVGFRASGTVVASLDSVHSKGNTQGVTAETGSRVTVSNSVLAGNSTGAGASAIGGAARLAVERSVVTGNTNGILVQTNGAGDVAELTSSRSIFTHNSVAAIASQQAVSATATVVADANTMTENGIGFFFVGAATVFTRGSNTLKYNTNDLLGGSLTALTGQ